MHVTQEETKQIFCEQEDSLLCLLCFQSQEHHLIEGTAEGLR
jgi:hypothetical protein